jgi:two-component system chemotaxis response regulator CheY
MAQKERVLVVEDDRDSRETLATALAQSGYAVDIVEDGREALGRLSSWPADVLVSDVNMPEMGGLDLIQALRASGRNQPVVLITGMEGDDVVGHAAEYGASACLRKPMTLDELIWAIECALACRRNSPDPRRAPRRRGFQ